MKFSINTYKDGNLLTIQLLDKLICLKDISAKYATSLAEPLSSSNFFSIFYMRDKFYRSITEIKGRTKPTITFSFFTFLYTAHLAVHPDASSTMPGYWPPYLAVITGRDLD